MAEETQGQQTEEKKPIEPSTETTVEASVTPSAEEKPIEEVKPDSLAYAQAKIDTANTQLAQAKEAKSETDEKALKEYRKKHLITGIGDMLTGLANLYFTTKGAPSMKLTSHTEKLADQFDKLAKASQASYEAYRDGLKKELDKGENMLQSAWRWQYKKERNALADKLKAQEQARKDRETDEGRIPKMKAEASKIKEQANTEQAKQNTERSKQRLNSARAGNVGKSQSSSSKSSYPIYDTNGNLVDVAHTPKEAIVKASQYGYNLQSGNDMYTGTHPSTDDILAQLGVESGRRQAKKKK